MNTTKILKELEVLRNYHKAGFEVAEHLISEIKKDSEPQNPRKRRNLKKERIAKYQNYAISGKVSKTNILQQALKKHNIE